jgi:hypothetical protein
VFNAAQTSVWRFGFETTPTQFRISSECLVLKYLIIFFNDARNKHLAVVGEISRNSLGIWFVLFKFPYVYRT